MKPGFLILIISLLTSGCDNVYREYNKSAFNGSIWLAQTALTFKPEINDLEKAYQITLALRHIYGVQHKAITVEMISQTPTGKKQSKRYSIGIRDEAGDYVGKCAGDLCDVEVVVEKGVRYNEVGAYTYIIRPEMGIPRISGIMEFGLLIDIEAEN